MGERTARTKRSLDFKRKRPPNLTRVWGKLQNGRDPAPLVIGGKWAI
jgi:hypothetical protein